MQTSRKAAWLRGRRPSFFYVGCTSALLIILFSLSRTFPVGRYPPETAPRPESSEYRSSQRWHFDATTDARNLGLSDEQCDIAFPKLYTELDRARDHLGPKSVDRAQVHLYSKWRSWRHAQMHVLIHTGQLYVLDEMKGACDRARGLAGLANLYRAITAVGDPTTIPDVEFILDLEDTPTLNAPEDRVVWAWNRPRTSLNTWVAPDFDGWAFPNPDLGSYVSFRERLPFVEQPFADKIPKAAWRGGMNNAVREALLAVTRDADWADVQPMSNGERLHMAEFCRYMFPVHTEGVAWSGRLRYLQNCDSAAVVHQPLKHHAHYYDLLVADGPTQNYIRVANDFSDLEEKIRYYLNDTGAAARIARNSVATFRDRYLTPAAEACYWRRMVRNWADVQAFQPERYVDVVRPDGSVWKRQRGVDWEIFAAPDPHFVLDFPGYHERGGLRRR